MSPDLLTILGFVAGALGVAGAYSLYADLFLRDSSRLKRRVDEEFRRNQRDTIQRSGLFKNVGQLTAEAEADGAGDLSRGERFNLMVEQSGVKVTAQQLLTYMIVLGMALAALVALTRAHVAAVPVAGLLGAAIPYLYVVHRRKTRLDKLLSQLPDAFDLMARMIRAGQTMTQALQAVGNEFDQPIAGEFAFCFEQQNLGLSSEMALRDLARRTGILEIKIFVLALVVQQQSGGNLAELLEKLATIIRQRFHIKGKIKSLTAEGRLQAAVLLVLPPLILVAVFLLNRTYAQALLDNPQLIVGMFTAELVGALWIRQIINFDF